jgi:hypothetical protein
VNKQNMMRCPHAARTEKLTWAKSLMLLAPLVLAPLVTTQAHAAGPKKTEASDTPFIGQTQIAVTIVQASRPAGVFQADIGLLIKDPAGRVRAKALQPILRDRWRRTTQEFANSYFAKGRAPDAELLGQKLQTATDAILGKDVARVLLTALVVR